MLKVTPCSLALVVCAMGSLTDLFEYDVFKLFRLHTGDFDCPWRDVPSLHYHVVEVGLSLGWQDSVGCVEVK